MKFFLIILLFLLTACGQQNYKGKSWPDSLNNQMNYYLGQANKENISIPYDYLQGLTVTFGDTASQGDGVIGYCQSYNGSSERDIVLDTQYWAGIDGTVQINLLWHELGHCLLNYVHRGQIDPNTFNPTSIMYAYVAWPTYFDAHTDQYEEEYWHPSQDRVALKSIPNSEFSNSDFRVIKD